MDLACLHGPRAPSYLWSVRHKHLSDLKNFMATQTNTTNLKTPLQNLEEWEDFLKERYPEVPEKTGAFNPGKEQEEFRYYEATARHTVREFYRLNHRYQTFDFVQSKQRDFLYLDRQHNGIREELEL